MDVDEGDEGCDIEEEEEEEEVVVAAKEDLDEVEDTLLLDLFNNEISKNVTLTQDLVTTKISKHQADTTEPHKQNPRQKDNE